MKPEMKGTRLYANANSKKKLKTSFLLIFTLFFIGLVSSAECNEDLSQGGNSCAITNDLTLNSTYSINMNGSAWNNGAISINSDNVTFDCNGSTIYGNRTNLSVLSPAIPGIFMNARNNLTIKNCNFKNFHHSIRVRLSSNVTIENCTFNEGIYNVWVDDSSFINFYNSTFKNSTHELGSWGTFRTEHSNYLRLENINISNGNVLMYLFNLTNSYFNNIKLNNSYSINFEAEYIWLDRNPSQYGSENITFNNSIFYDGTSTSLGILSEFSTNTYFNNIISYLGRLYHAGNGTNYFSLNNITTSAYYIQNAFIYVPQGTNGIISFINMTNTNNSIVFTNNANNITLKNSYFDNLLHGPGTKSEFLQSRDGANNTYFINNTISTIDVGIMILNVSNCYLYNNTISNLNISYDGFGVGIRVHMGSTNNKKTNNIIIDGNNITYSNAGVSLMGVNNSIISNNYFYEESTQWKIDNNHYGYFMIPSAISIVELWSTWTGGTDEVFGNNRTNKIENMSSNNITLINNQYDSSVQIFLNQQGTTNILHNLTNFWFRKFQFPIYLVDVQEIYFSNNYNNITQCLLGICGNMFGQGYMTPYSPNYSNYTWIDNQYDYYLNLHNDSHQLNLYNLTNALVYSNNGTVFGSSTITSNNGEINVTLQPNNSSYVLDNFNVTEGVTRENSPINFSVATSTRKSITNSLAELIIVPVTFSVTDCSTVGVLTYNSDDGSQSTIYQPGDYTCIDSTITLTLTLDPATSSNELGIEYNAYINNLCSTIIAGPGVFFNYTRVFMTLLAILFTILITLVLVNYIDPASRASIDDSTNLLKSFPISMKLVIILLGIMALLSIVLFVVVDSMCKAL